MVDGLNARGEWRVASGMWLLQLACCLLPVRAHAEISDPTRPPSGFSEAPKSEVTPIVLRVSSLFLMGKKSYAIVAGRMFRIGDKLDSGRVRRIDERGVWIETASGVRQIKLLPQVRKTPAGKMEQQ